MTPAPEMPGFWKFIWMFWMQPITLHRLLRQMDVDTRASLASLWRERRLAGHQARYLRLCLQMYVAVLVPLAAGVIMARGFGMALSWRIGDFMVALSVVGGIVSGVFLSIASGVALGVSMAYSVALVVISVPFDVHSVVARGLAVTVLRIIAAGIRGIVIGLLFGGAVSDPGLRLTFGSAGISKVNALSRLPVYFGEVLIEMILISWQKLTSAVTLQFAPVLHHDLSYLPHPFLTSHIVDTACRDVELARRVLDACQIVPGQRRAGQKALLKLQAQELALFAKARRFEHLAELRGVWLPGLQGAPDELRGFAELGRYLRSAAISMSPDQRTSKLRQAEATLQALRNQQLPPELRSTLDDWRTVVTSMLAEADRETANKIPNVFRAGDPLAPDEGPMLFRGRETEVRNIERLLADTVNQTSIVLLGPRRCGKTSLLKMLPTLLPEVQCVFFDLQDNPANSLDSFFRALHKRAVEQSIRERRIKIPDLPPGPAIESAAEWIRLLEEAAGRYRILICIDEFERLEEVFGGTQRELLQLMGLVRGTIQHRRKVKLLVSGVAPFDELGPMWDDHFVNAREVRIGHLDRETSIGLLTKPVPEFPADAIPTEVAAQIFERTGGQPYLLQLYGSKLVSLLNDQERKASTLADLPVVEDQVLSEARSYFSYTVRTAPPGAHAVLEALAQNQQPAIDAASRRWLERRCLLTPDQQLAIPVLANWIREQVLA